MRVALVLTALVFLCIVVWWLPRDDPDGAAPEQHTTPAAEVQIRDLHGSDTETQAASGKREEILSDDPPTATSGILIRGTFEVRGSDRSTHSEESGKFEPQPFRTHPEHAVRVSFGDAIRVELTPLK